MSILNIFKSLGLVETGKYRLNKGGERCQIRSELKFYKKYI